MTRHRKSKPPARATSRPPVSGVERTGSASWPPPGSALTPRGNSASPPALASERTAPSSRPPRGSWRAAFLAEDSDSALLDSRAAGEGTGFFRPVRPGRLAFPTVGVGASAGGLAALEAFLDAMPAAPGFAIVIVTHQLPHHESLLPELLARHTALPVGAISAGLEVESDHVYVSTPGKDVAVIGGRFVLSERARDSGLRLPIDTFFRSLALDQEDHAICVVLSGTGTDGSLGLRAVKGLGGMVLVQDEHSAQYPGMPLSAAATLLADCVLPPNAMPAQLVLYARDIQSATGERGALELALSDTLKGVFGLLQQRTGHDFSGYKPAAVARRIQRRMRVHHLVDASEYLALLKSHPHELDLLFSELLINVTSFFRDSEPFHSLEPLLRQRLAARTPGDPALRLWVAGCSTGEEAYSIAMLLAEINSDSDKRSAAQIFATDIDPAVIEYARLGLYPAGIAADVGAERLARYFTPEGNNYRITKQIRELCVFAIQSLIKDPPFTKLDFVSCRNLLIYLDSSTQQRLFPLFHYALKPGGLLLLGSSETIAGFEHLFKPLDRKHKIYERLALAPEAQTGYEGRPPWPQPHRNTVPPRAAASKLSSLATQSDKLLLERFAPPTLIVNANGDIAYIHGRTGAYLEPNSGEPQHNLLVMAREGLHGILASALRRASRDAHEIVYTGVQVQATGSRGPVNVIVARLSEPEALRGLYRVSFDQAPANFSGERRHSPPPGRLRGPRDTQLERELKHARGALQGSIEELQSSNEQLKSMNEELQSTNEELQSSNEELETSKEELQSLNEELQTVNLQLQLKMDELSHANDDMANLLESTDIATVFLDRNLCIKRFTDLAREVISLIPADVGRPVGNLASNLRYDALTEDAQHVLDTLLPHEVEVQTRQGQWRLVRMIPYRTSQNVIDGVAITFLDIDRVKRPELLSASRALADSIVNTVREPLAVLDEFLTIAAANPAFLRTFNLDLSQIEQRSLYEVGLGAFAVPEMRLQLHRLLIDGIPFEDFALEYASPIGGPRCLLVNARRLFGPITTPCHVLLGLHDSGRPGSLLSAS
jgi:two-component system CheB/CheR fusion protein